MSAIFDNASSIKQGNKLSLMSATTISGKRVSQRRGPFLYQFDVIVNMMPTSSEAYRNIRKEIAAMDYGVNALQTTIPSLTANGESWGNPFVDGSSQTGRNVVIGGLTPNRTDIIHDGDFVQFDNNGKVYQVVGDFDSDGSGDATIKLNTPLIGSPTHGSLITTGTSVQFNLAIDNAEFVMGFTPRTATDNLVSPGTFLFTEVII